MLYFIQLDALVTKYKPKFNKSKAILFPSYDCWNLVSRLCFLNFCYSFTSPVRTPRAIRLERTENLPHDAFILPKGNPDCPRNGQFFVALCI